jgi:hypothetical protein
VGNFNAECVNRFDTTRIVLLKFYATDNLLRTFSDIETQQLEIPDNIGLSKKEEIAMALEDTKIGKIGPRFSFGCETRIEQVEYHILLFT